MSTGVDADVEGALSSPVATVVAGVAGREAMLSFLDETVGSLVAFSLSAVFLINRQATLSPSSSPRFHTRHC